MRAKITAVSVDGTTSTAEGSYSTWGDQIAFERRFGVNATVLASLADAFDDDGRPIDGEAEKIRSEWVAFLAWRVLRRELRDEISADYEAWIDALDDLELHVFGAKVDGDGAAESEEDDAPADPTGTAAAPPIS